MVKALNSETIEKDSTHFIGNTANRTKVVVTVLKDSYELEDPTTEEYKAEGKRFMEFFSYYCACDSFMEVMLEFLQKRYPGKVKTVEPTVAETKITINGKEYSGNLWKTP